MARGRIAPRIAHMLNFDLFGSSGGKRAKRRRAAKIKYDKKGRSPASQKLAKLRIF